MCLCTAAKMLDIDTVKGALPSEKDCEKQEMFNLCLTQQTNGNRT